MPGAVSQTATSWSGFGYGRGLRRTPFTTLKIAAVRSAGPGTVLQASANPTGPGSFRAEARRSQTRAARHSELPRAACLLPRSLAPLIPGANAFLLRDRGGIARAAGRRPTAARIHRAIA